jgi:hypothetical protein
LSLAGALTALLSEAVSVSSLDCVVQLAAMFEPTLLAAERTGLASANCGCAAALAKMFWKESALAFSAEFGVPADGPLSGVAAVQAKLGGAEDEITR